MLVEIVGQEIGISGAVWACGHPCTQPLSANVPFLPVPSDQRWQLQQARFCMAIRCGFDRLQSFYQTAPTEENDQAGFPYPKDCRLTIDNQKQDVTLRYLQTFHPEARRMLFVAQVNAGGGRTLKVLVKFTAQYNPQAHALAADAGLAPKLYGVEDVGGMKMVVMELLEVS